MHSYYKRTFAKKQEYNGVIFKSGFEKDFAMFLDGKIVRNKGVNYYHEPIKWTYEEKKFELIPQEKWVDKTELDKGLKRLVRHKQHTLNKVVYTPDFYLPEYDLLIETKGFQFDNEAFRLRLRLFKHQYPHCAIWVIRHHEDFDKIDDVIKSLNIDKDNKNT